VEVEAHEGEPPALLRVPTLESYQRAFLIGELEGKFPQPLREGFQVGSGVFFMLKAHHAIIGIAHKMHPAATVFGHDALDPVVLHKVKVDVGQNGANDSPPISDFRFQISNFKFQISNFRFPISDFRATF